MEGSKGVQKQPMSRGNSVYDLEKGPHTEEKSHATLRWRGENIRIEILCGAGRMPMPPNDARADVPAKKAACKNGAQTRCPRLPRLAGRAGGAGRLAPVCLLKRRVFTVRVLACQGPTDCGVQQNRGGHPQVRHQTTVHEKRGKESGIVAMVS